MNKCGMKNTKFSTVDTLLFNTSGLQPQAGCTTHFSPKLTNTLQVNSQFVAEPLLSFTGFYPETKSHVWDSESKLSLAQSLPAVLRKH